MRILHVAGEFPPHRLGGTATFLENVVRELSESHDVAVVVVRGRDYHLDPTHERARVRVEQLDLEPAFAALEELRQLDATTLRELCPRTGLLAERWDVVHVHDWYGVLPALAVADHAEIVMTPHLPLRYGFTYANHPIPTLEKARLEALGFRVARRTLAPSQYIARLLEAEYSVAPNKIHVVPNGVDPTTFAPGPRAKVPTILSVSRLAVQKGLDHLLRILAQVRSECPDARLVVVGDGPQRNAFEAEARRLQLEDAVELRGYVAHGELSELYAAAHVFVSASVYEPFGLTTLEAMAAGTPVVASPIGGASDFVREGVDGFLRNPAETKPFATAVARLLNEPELREAAGKHARARANEHTWTSTAGLLAEHYAQVVAPTPAGRSVVLAWHVHQPFFVPDQEVLSWVAESYRPLLALHRERQIPFCLNVSGGLLRRLAELAPDFVAELAQAAENGDVELLGSGMYHPLLPLLPAERARAQIEGDLRAKRELLGRTPVGFWPADLGFAHWLVEPLAREGVSHVAYEASSHGLSQYRNEGLPVAAGAFTNLSRDHLDYHGTMEEYFAAKMRLFDEVVSDGGHAIIWDGGDEWARRACGHAQQQNLRVFTVGEKGENLRLLARSPSQLGQELTIAYEGQERKVHLPLIGAYQAANALVSAALVIATGGDAKATFDALGRLQPVRGRLERAAISAAGAPIYVDYAHTPDALEAAIAALRPHVTGRLITVFGAGGDRDKGKREPMGRVAAELSDIVIVTDDNPRGEEAAAIRQAVLHGAQGATEIADRREAIAAAILRAGPDDIVLIAGKGHEQGQIVGAGDSMRILPFDDVEVARECAIPQGAGQ